MGGAKDDPGKLDLSTTILAGICVAFGAVFFVTAVAAASICFLKKKKMRKHSMAIPNVDSVDIAFEDEKILNPTSVYTSDNEQNDHRDTASEQRSYHQGTYRNAPGGRQNEYVDTPDRRDGQDDYYDTPQHATIERDGSLHLLHPSASPKPVQIIQESPGVYVDEEMEEYEEYCDS